MRLDDLAGHLAEAATELTAAGQTLRPPAQAALFRRNRDSVCDGGGRTADKSTEAVLIRRESADPAMRAGGPR